MYSENFEKSAKKQKQKNWAIFEKKVDKRWAFLFAIKDGKNHKKSGAIAIIWQIETMIQWEGFKVST